jgi:heterodisulfide reductase subunit A
MNVYAALAHPIREQILRTLDAERLLPYKDLMDRLSLKETGLFNYHLKKLEGLIEKRDGLYQLTAAGRNAMRLMTAKEQLMAGKTLDVAETDARGAIFRTGVIICSCGEELRQSISIGELVEKVGSLPYVERTRVFPHLCMLENVEQLKEWCERHFLNNIVIAACSPTLHREMFTTIRDKLDVPVEFANIREHCAWVNPQNPEAATEKALLLIRARSEMLRHRVPVPKRTVPIRKSIAIIGGGLAALTCANILAKANYSVVLMERDSSIGGISRRWERVYGALDCGPCMIAEEVSSVLLSANARILTNTEFTDISGTIGNYEITATQHPRYVDLGRCTACGTCADVCPQSKPDEFEFGLTTRKFIHLPCPAAYPNKPVIEAEDIEFCRTCRKCEQACPSHAINLDQPPIPLKFTVGAVILATGAEVTDPRTVLPIDTIAYDPSKDVISSYEFERMLAPDGPTGGKIIQRSTGKPARSVAILQCVNLFHNCSSYCCNVAQKYLDVVAQNDPKTAITVLYQRSRMPADRTTLIPDDKRIHLCETIKVSHRGRRREIETEEGSFPADLIVLNVGMIPGEQLFAIRTMINFSVDRRGFLDPKTLPSGIWACGSVTGPKTYHGLVTEARNAALEALLLMAKDSLPVGESAVRIDQSKCGLCNLCVELCPFNAISVTGDSIRIDAFKCRNCGACTAICPTGALSAAPSHEEIEAAIGALSMSTVKPKILVFCCESCGYAAADNAGLRRLEYDIGAYVLRLPCTGCIDAKFVMTALQRGFDGVMVVGCHETACRFVDGIQKAKQRIGALTKFYGDELERRVRALSVSAVEGQRFADRINQFAAELKEMATA